MKLFKVGSILATSFLMLGASLAQAQNGDSGAAASKTMGAPAGGNHATTQPTTQPAEVPCTKSLGDADSQQLEKISQKLSAAEALITAKDTRQSGQSQVKNIISNDFAQLSPAVRTALYAKVQASGLQNFTTVADVVATKPDAYGSSSYASDYHPAVAHGVTDKDLNLLCKEASAALKKDDQALEKLLTKYFDTPAIPAVPGFEKDTVVKFEKVIRALAGPHALGFVPAQIANSSINISAEAQLEKAVSHVGNSYGGYGGTYGDYAATTMAQYRNEVKSDPNHLTAADLYMIKMYTGSYYQQLNSALRSKDATQLKTMSTQISTLNRALSKLPDYRGPVNRGASLPEAVLAQHTVGSVVTYPAYTSTSTDEGFSGQQHFRIYSKHGKYVEPYTSCRGEQEVLFLPDTKFKILDRQDHDGVSDITMVEVD